MGQDWGNNEADCQLSKYKTQNVANVVGTMEIGRLDINERERRVRRRELPTWMRIVCWQGPTY